MANKYFEYDDLDTMTNADEMLDNDEIDPMEHGIIMGYMEA